MTELTGVCQSAVSALWPKVGPLLRRACDRADGRYVVDDVLAALLRREMQLWITVDQTNPGRIEAVCVTEIVDYPQEKRCGLVFCAGRHSERWLHHLQAIGDWARAQGCVAMEMQGRPGWERLLGDWKKTHVLLTKRL